MSGLYGEGRVYPGSGGLKSHNVFQEEWGDYKKVSSAYEEKRVSPIVITDVLQRMSPFPMDIMFEIDCVWSPALFCYGFMVVVRVDIMKSVRGR